MEHFIKFGRRSLFVILLAMFAGRLVFDLRAGEYAGALKNAFAYSTFITLVFGLLLSIVWVALNVIKAVRPGH